VRWLLPEDEDAWLTTALAFIPMRLVSGVAAQLPGGETATVSSFLTHLFVHGDTTHLLVNMAWLLAFGSPVARRTDAWRFLAFFAICGVAGALFYVLVNGRVLTLVVGASGAISGLMGGAMRFFFTRLGATQTLGVGQPLHAAPLLSLAATVRNKRIVLAILGWTILNVVLAWGAAGLTDAAGIAWEAHVGGFYAGLLTYGLFDRQAQDDKVEERNRSLAWLQEVAHNRGADVSAQRLTDCGAEGKQGSFGDL
jgi:membrane associated rhomboid family serine protease